MPLKRYFDLSVRIQDPAPVSGTAGGTFSEGVCEALGPQGRCWKITSEPQVLCMGDLAPSRHLSKGGPGLGVAHECQGKEPRGPEAAQWMLSSYLL